MAIQKIIATIVTACGMGALLWAAAEKEVPSGTSMQEAASAFLGTLNESQRTKALYKYDDPERLNWHFIPRPRNGLPLKELEGEQLQAANRLLASGLSKRGYEQALSVMSLEEILYLLEGGDRQERRARRDPTNYYLTIFGEPAAQGTWGWRVEGHHLSLNYSVTDGNVVASTPEFFGANPALVNAGPERAVRILGTEEDIARSILKLCNAEQQKAAWISKDAPDDLRGGGVAQPETTAPVGLRCTDMSPDQKKLLESLLNEYLANMPEDVSARRRDELQKAGTDNVYFAWWGAPELNERHYYRVQGPKFLIEYNNTQNNANHVHSVWRDLQGDFNLPIKK